MTNYMFRFHHYTNMHDEEKYDLTRYWTGGKAGIAWTGLANDINIDILDVVLEAHRHCISFDEMLSHAISHEIIHNILDKEVSRKCTIQLDKICSGKGISYKYWTGGIL